MSYPSLPPTHNHPLWDSWDLQVELTLQQLVAHEKARATEAEVHCCDCAYTLRHIMESVLCPGGRCFCCCGICAGWC